MSKEAMKLALEALEGWNKGFPDNWGDLDTEAVTALREALAEQPAQQEPTNLLETFDQFGEGWERLAWELCAEEHGEDACSELIWEGGPIPEPWGDRWLKYEDEAKRLIALVHKCTAPQAQPQQEPVAWDNCRSEKQCRSWCGNSACGSHWNDTSPPTLSLAQRKPTEEMVVAAARVLSERHAAACSIDWGDLWKLHGNDFIDDARAALEAAHGIKGDA